MAQNEYLAPPRESQCEYLEKETEHMLSGCPDNDTCPSWFGNLLSGYGDIKDEGPEAKSLRELVAREKSNERETEFSCKYLVRKPILPRPQPESFWLTISRDSFTDDQPVDSVSTLNTETEEEDVANSLEFKHHLVTHAQRDEARDENVIEHDSKESQEVGREDQPPNNPMVNRLERVNTPLFDTKTIGEEYQDLVAPIWNWFYPVVDTGRDGDLYD
ncbi:hypothetical protein ACHAPU_008768 [Fusarium lateritium]